MSKQCTRCQKQLGFDQYSPDKRNKDGLQSQCHACRKSYKQLERDRRKEGIGLKIISEKTCNKCSITKTVDKFYRDMGLADGYGTICKECKHISTNAWREKKRTEYNAYMKKYRKTHPEKYSQARNRGLKHRYGIDQMEYNRLLVEQLGNCAICRKPPTDKPLVVDHNHDTGKVRGLIHSGCNVAIAILDNEELLQQALDYKKKTEYP